MPAINVKLFTNFKHQILNKIDLQYHNIFGYKCAKAISTTNIIYFYQYIKYLWTKVLKCFIASRYNFHWSKDLPIFIMLVETSYTMSPSLPLLFSTHGSNIKVALVADKGALRGAELKRFIVWLILVKTYIFFLA